MGVTGFDFPFLETIIKNYDIKSVVEMGAQNDYRLGGIPAPYMKPWYENQGIKYLAIDQTGEDNSMVQDLSDPLNMSIADFEEPFDLVTDFGTGEHIGKEKAFNIEAFYNFWKTKFDLAKEKGIIISENPMTGNWPGHGFTYMTLDFYRELEAASNLKIILLDTHPAMGNDTDGWNVICIMIKKGLTFPDLETFKTFSYKEA